MFTPHFRESVASVALIPCINFDTNNVFLRFSRSNNFLHLLNTESLLLLFLRKQLNHDHKHNAQSEISITHNTVVLPGKRKAKNPNYHILCIS
jgi:hypothetical protein